MKHLPTLTIYKDNKKVNEFESENLNIECLKIIYRIKVRGERGKIKRTPTFANYENITIFYELCSHNGDITKYRYEYKYIEI